MLYKNNVNFCLKFKLINKLAAKLKKLIIFYRKNFYNTQKLQKCLYNENIKPKSYVYNNKI